MWSHDTTGCFKKSFLRIFSDFLTLKMLALALALIKTKNRHLFDPLVRKCSFYMRVFGGWRQFSIEKGLFFTNGSKRWRFFVLINTRANANIFKVKKSLKILKKLFLKHPVSSEDQNSAAPFLFMLVSARLSLTHWYYCKL